jgi:hypothetical protein
MTSIPWAKEFPGEITVCDAAGVVLEMNDRVAEHFEKDGGRALVGTNLLDCHPEPSRTKLLQLLSSGQVNAYTIRMNFLIAACASFLLGSAGFDSVAWSVAGDLQGKPHDTLAAVAPPIDCSPGTKYADSARMFQGIPAIERSANGRLWAAWYGGGVTEDRHNYVMLVTSDDDG